MMLVWLFHRKLFAISPGPTSPRSTPHVEGPGRGCLGPSWLPRAPWAPMFGAQGFCRCVVKPESASSAMTQQRACVQKLGCFLVDGHPLTYYTKWPLKHLVNVKFQTVAFWDTLLGTEWDGECQFNNRRIPLFLNQTQGRPPTK